MPSLRDDYSVNALNQYISRENNTVSISGTAATDAVVAAKGRNVTAGRQGRFWSDEVTVPNVLGPWAGPLSVYANKSVGGSSVMRIDSRSAAIPAVAQSITYDLDGNTLSDGLWDYQWDAENRLVRLETTVAARGGGIAHRIINFTYDYLGRRVQKQVIDGVTVTELSSARFIYNGWDIIAEYSVLNGSALDKLQRTYAWGVDIAGSLADAGGVGALLQFANSTTGTAYLPSYDGNGNVTSLINLGTGALAAAYEYSPYGEMLRDEILDNAVSGYSFKFSTKWRDGETGWMNYGRRYYDPRNGRFIGRDPIAEEGGINLYAFCGNNPVDRWDRLGMDYLAAPNEFGAWVEMDGPTGTELGETWLAAAGNIMYGVTPVSDESKRAAAQANLAAILGSTGASAALMMNGLIQSNLAAMEAGINSINSNSLQAAQANLANFSNSVLSAVQFPSFQLPSLVGGPSSVAANSSKNYTTYTGEITYSYYAYILSYGSFAGTINDSSGNSYAISGSINGVGFQAGYFSGASPVSFTVPSPDEIGSNGVLFTTSVGVGVGPINLVAADASVFVNGQSGSLSTGGVEVSGILLGNRPVSNETDPSNPAESSKLKVGIGFSFGVQGTTVINVTPISSSPSGPSGKPEGGG